MIDQAFSGPQKLQVANPGETQRATMTTDSATASATDAQPTSLKALANKVLLRNSSRNSSATEGLAARNNSENQLLKTALIPLCRDLPISAREVYEELAPEDIADWANGSLSSACLKAFAESLVQRREMAAGKIPPHYTERATCQGCGPVWLWFEGEILGCPWCWNRAAGRPIPTPVPKPLD